MTNSVTEVQNVVNEEEVQRRIIKATADMEDPGFEFEKTEDYRSVEQFIASLANYKFNDPIQRSAGAWSIQAKSLLIVSLLEVISIGEITVQVIRKNKKLIRNVLDGKQRLTTIRDFVKGKFALSERSYVMAFDKEGNVVWIDISGLYFEELPPFYKRRILATMIKFDLYEIDDDMKYELFKRRNNGVALTQSQLRKSKMPVDLLVFVAGLMESPIFQAGLTEKAVNSDVHLDLILKAMAVLLTDNNTALSGTALDKLLEEDAYVEGVRNQTVEITNYLNGVFPLLDEKAASKSFGTSKTISLVYVANTALREGRDPQQFAEWMNQFFVKDYAKSGYGSTSGTAKLESVKRRNEIIMKHYNNFFQA